ncbi:bifunctional riboflavin kinase/FAD synthetase [Pseudogracilibacillus sp. SE30717A]|uniref:bifunctional riboflavin kinase/FAD synthetase n=1 Tax=Pseudogracilibacillus sp. SE30717A TaxID=3098293 RepID=UPI00300DE1D6
MQIIRLTYPHTFNKTEIPETIAAAGFFDGLHKGHQAVIQEAIKLARDEGKESAVISFYPHPKEVLNRPEKPMQYITPNAEKEQLLKDMGVDKLYLITFDRDLANLSPQGFVDHFIIGLNIVHLVAGFDFSFGHKGAGNMNNINSFSKGKFTTTSIEPVKLDGEKVSSTEIRHSLSTGNVEKVKKLLGRAYETEGIVIEGEKRGRQIGFPTANLKIDDEKLIPKQGVYAVRVKYNKKLFKGMANLGVKPTFHENEVTPSIEIHIFDFNDDLYSKNITVLWDHFIREEKKFAGVDELIKQLKQDEYTVQEYFQ